MNFCHLMDLGFFGPKYTWSNLRGISDLIQECFDRCWADSDWKLLYPEAIVCHLPRVNSDHYPLLLNLDTLPPPHRDRPLDSNLCGLVTLIFLELSVMLGLIKILSYLVLSQHSLERLVYGTKRLLGTFIVGRGEFWQD